MSDPGSTAPDMPKPRAGSAANRVVSAVVNPVTGGVLASPAHRLFSGALVELGYVGPRSGRRISLVTQYAPDGEDLVVYVGAARSKTWWRAFRGAGRPIRVRLRGTVRAGHARVLMPGDEGYAPAVATYRARWPRLPEDQQEPVVRITFPSGGPSELHPRAAGG